MLQTFSSQVSTRLPLLNVCISKILIYILYLIFLGNKSESSPIILEKEAFTCTAPTKGIMGGVRRYVVCCCSVTQLCLTLCNPMNCSTPDFPVLHCLLELLKLMSIDSVMLSNLLILSSFSSCLQSFPASAPFPMSGFFPSGGLSIRASASVLPRRIQG